jgi:hypothetical protein
MALVTTGIFSSDAISNVEFNRCIGENFTYIYLALTD